MSARTPVEVSRAVYLPYETTKEGRAEKLMAIGPIRLVRLVIELQDRITELERA